MTISELYYWFINPSISTLPDLDEWSILEHIRLKLEQAVKERELDYREQWKSVRKNGNLDSLPAPKIMSDEDRNTLKKNYKSLMSQLQRKTDSMVEKIKRDVPTICNLDTDSPITWKIDLSSSLRTDDSFSLNPSWISDDNLVYAAAAPAYNGFDRVLYLVEQVIRNRTSSIACLFFRSTDAERFKRNMEAYEGRTSIHRHISQIVSIDGFIYVVFRTSEPKWRTISYYDNGKMTSIRQAVKSELGEHLYGATGFIHPRVAYLCRKNAQKNSLYLQAKKDDYTIIPPDAKYSYLKDDGSFEPVSENARPVNISGRCLGRAVYPPSVILDLSTMQTTYLTIERKGKRVPFLLDDDQVAIELLRPCFNGRETISSQDYKYLSERMNRVLGRRFYAMSHDKEISMPGKIYTFCREEKELIVDSIWKEMESRASRVKPTLSNGGNDKNIEWLRPYYDNMVKHGFLKIQNDEYITTSKFSTKSDQALFAILVSAREDRWKLRYDEGSPNIIKMSCGKGVGTIDLKGRPDWKAFESTIKGIEPGVLRGNKRNAIDLFEYYQGSDKTRKQFKHKDPESLKNIAEIIEAVFSVSAR